MRQSESLYFDVRRLRYHVRHWPGDPARRIVVLHGWMDVSASFQFLVDAMSPDWDVYAPDWRGYGLTDWGRSDCYWFPDYLGDLDALLDRIQPDAAVDLVHFTILRPPDKQDLTPVRELSLIAFPIRELFEVKLNDFDLIIFDRYKNRGVLPSIYIDNIARYVENGGAVLESAGP